MAYRLESQQGNKSKATGPLSFSFLLLLFFFLANLIILKALP